MTWFQNILTNFLIRQDRLQMPLILNHGLKRPLFSDKKLKQNIIWTQYSIKILIHRSNGLSLTTIVFATSNIIPFISFHAFHLIQAQTLQPSSTSPSAASSSLAMLDGIGRLYPLSRPSQRASPFFPNSRNHRWFSQWSVTKSLLQQTWCRNKDTFFL